MGNGGNLAMIVQARFSTALYMGELHFDHWTSPLLRTELRRTLALALLSYPLVGLAAWAVAVALVGSGAAGPLPELLAISQIGGVIPALFAVMLTLILTRLAFRQGLDPDNVVLPVLTAALDLVGVLSLISVATLLL